AAMMPGSRRRRCASVPSCSSVGPIWRSANQAAAIGAPVLMSASKTTKRSSGLRPPPPCSTGQVMPSHPRAPSSAANSRSCPVIQLSSGTSARSAAARPTFSASSRRASSSGDRLKSMEGDASQTVVGPSIRSGSVRGAMSRLHIRPVRADEHAALGELTVDAYASADPRTLDDGYSEELRDVAGRARDAVVLVAVDEGTGEVVGGVTFVPDVSSPLAEFTEPDAAGIRMLAVAPHARGRGVGEALTRACIDRARAGGRRQVVLHSTDRMTAAHRLYTRLGF